MMRFFTKYFPLKITIPIICILIAVIILGPNYLVDKASGPYVIQSPDRLPHESVGLVLGCAPTLRRGQDDPFFTNRLQAAAQLFKLGKVDHLLVSGDNHSRYYDEPTAMQAGLIKLGVPASAITCDYAGFTTLDSIIRAKKVFGVTHFTVISQRDHALRAVFMARYLGCDVYGFPAREISPTLAPRTYLRETFSRVKALFDLCIIQRSPRFLGKFEPITQHDAGPRKKESKPS